MPSPPMRHEAVPRQVRVLLLARLLATIALAAQVTIVGKQVFDITGRELDLGLLGLAEFVPTLLMAPIAGTLADRFDRRIMTGIGLAGETITAILLLLYTRSDPTSVGPIFALVILFGIFRGLAGPAFRSLPIDLSRPGQVERIQALHAFAWQSGGIAGPVIAGFLYERSPADPYAFVATLLAVSAVLMIFVPASGVERVTGPTSIRQSVHDAFEGLRFIRRTRVLLGAISLDLFAVLFGGAVALLPAIAEDRLGVGAVGLGWLRAAVGIGAAVTSAALAWRPISRHIGPVLLGCVGVFGVATIALGFTRSFTMAFIALLILSGSDAVSVFIRSTIVPLATPEHMRGRVMATEQVFIGASNELGAFESGVAAALIGLVGAVVSGGVGTLIVVAAFWRVFPELSRVDRFDEIAAERPTHPPPD